MQRVQCSFCHSEYDLGKVEVIARYTDCTVFKTPCCGVEADDRPKMRPDYTIVKERSYTDVMFDIIMEGRLEQKRLNELRERNRRKSKYT